MTFEMLGLLLAIYCYHSLLCSKDLEAIKSLDAQSVLLILIIVIRSVNIFIVYITNFGCSFIKFQNDQTTTINDDDDYKKLPNTNNS